MTEGPADQTTTRRRLPLPGPALRGAVAVLLALGFAVFMWVDRSEMARFVFALACFTLPALALALLPELVRRWKEVLLALAALALSLGVVQLASPLLVPLLFPEGYEPTLLHAREFCELCANNDGVQQTHPQGPFRDDDLNIVFLGDSFTQGVLLPIPQAGFPFLVERLLREAYPEETVRVANFGWASSSPVVQARQLAKLGPTYKPDLVVQVFDMTDFANDRAYLKRVDELEDAVKALELLEIKLAVLLGVPDPGEWLWGRLRIPPPDHPPDLDE